jgi:serine/threonine protein phosphatase PrpC
VNENAIVTANTSYGALQALHINGYEIYYFTHHAQYKDHNDDNLMIVPIADKGVILAVADGVGSAKKASEASSELLHAISRGIQNCDSVESLKFVRNNILDVIESINAKLSSMSGYLTTLTIGCFFENNAQVFQIGDSGLVVCGQRGKLKYKTMSHSPVGYAVEAGMLEPEDALDHPENHIVDNVVGDHILNVEVSSIIEIAKNDTAFIATDGLFDNYLLDSIIEIVRKGKLEHSANQFTADILAQYNSFQEEAYIKDDDMTFILCRMHSLQGKE